VDGKDRDTEQQSTVVKNQHWAGKWADAEKRTVDFCGLQMKIGTQHTYSNTQSNTQQHTAANRAILTAHGKHSKRCYALFLRSANSSTAGRRLKQRVGRYTASCLRYVAVAF